MKLFKDYFDRKKPWINNRKRFELTTFDSFHSKETSLNLLFDKLMDYLNNDLSSFDYFGSFGLKRNSLKQGFDVENYVENLKKIHPAFGIDFEDSSKKGNIQSCSIRRMDLKVYEYVSLGIQYFTEPLKSNFISLINPETLFLAYYAEIDYVNWQSMGGAISNYKYQGGLNFTFNKFGEKVVDISDRPGRKLFTKYFNYCGGSELWFGPMIYKYIPQQLILKFEGAIEIKIINNNITYVHLYEGVYDGDDIKNQEIQSRFRKHLNLDEKLNELNLSRSL
jgi:hypothetical protein